MNARVATLLVMVGVAAIAATGVVGSQPTLVWNASESVPVGLYRLRSARPIAIRDLVAVRPPERLALLLSEGGYLPLGAPMLKRVAALGGQIVCREGALVMIDGDVVGVSHERDSAGRPLPVWQGCHVLSEDEFFPMNAAPDSLDGRYFGPLPRSAIVGHALLLWAPNNDLSRMRHAESVC